MAVRAAAQALTDKDPAQLTKLAVFNAAVPVLEKIRKEIIDGMADLEEDRQRAVEREQQLEAKRQDDKLREDDRRWFFSKTTAYIGIGVSILFGVVGFILGMLSLVYGWQCEKAPSVLIQSP